ncbi:MAG: SDR family oxidoreductase [Lachnospiraceae bacterium]|nr:SDR family oxidoreductase [Lachnospiraceae bacterium]
MSETQTALVTGASRGIGRAIAEKLASEGMRLYITCKNSDSELRSLAADLSARYAVPCTPLVFDVADPAGVRETVRHIPSLDIVINCAGVAHFSLLQETGDDDWDRVIGTDLSGAFQILKHTIPLLLQSSQARILNISSVWGSRGAAMESAYSAAKGGLDALTRSLARELAPNGIPVNAIACGVIDTAMNRSALSEEDLQALREEIPAGRFGTAEETADLALLILRAPVYLTGQIISLDGGWKI